MHIQYFARRCITQSHNSHTVVHFRPVTLIASRTRIPFNRMNSSLLSEMLGEAKRAGIGYLATYLDGAWTNQAVEPSA